MSHLLKFLKGSNDAEFEVKNERLSCTVGIWIWPEFIKWTDPNSGIQRNILLMDVEGLYGADELVGTKIGEFLKNIKKNEKKLVKMKNNRIDFLPSLKFKKTTNEKNNYSF